MTKLKLNFVNKGKPFILENWTVAKHKKVLEEINKLPKAMDENDKDIEFQYFCIYVGLKAIDSEVDLEDIRNIHPTVLVDLFNAVYSEGKVDIYFRDKVKKSKSK